MLAKVRLRVYAWLFFAVGSLVAAPVHAQPATPSQLFIGALYQDLLGRPIDASGQQIAGQLTSGLLTRAQVVDLYLSSTEHRERQVREYYQQFLGREPSAGEVSGLVSLLATGYDPVRTAMLGSAEYFASQGGSTPGGFVQSLFMDLLGRSPTTSEQSTYVNALTSGVTTSAIANQVVNSPESHDRLVAQYYMRYLDRPVDPVGATGFGALLNSGVDDPIVIRAILGSEEYFQNAVPEPGVGGVAATMLLIGRRRSRARLV
jgi:hypothetical protein